MFPVPVSSSYLQQHHSVCVCVSVWCVCNVSWHQSDETWIVPGLANKLWFMVTKLHKDPCPLCGCSHQTILDLLSCTLTRFWEHGLSLICMWQQSPSVKHLKTWILRYRLYQWLQQLRQLWPIGNQGRFPAAEAEGEKYNRYSSDTE